TQQGGTKDEPIGPRAGSRIRGWGAWAQAGYDVDPHWSLWAYYGMDQPDAARFTNETGGTLARQLSHVGDALLRYRAGRYALGLEWYRAATRYNRGPARADRVDQAPAEVAQDPPVEPFRPVVRRLVRQVRQGLGDGQRGGGDRRPHLPRRPGDAGQRRGRGAAGARSVPVPVPARGVRAA